MVGPVSAVLRSHEPPITRPMSLAELRCKARGSQDQAGAYRELNQLSKDAAGVHELEAVVCGALESDSDNMLKCAAIVSALLDEVDRLQNDRITQLKAAYLFQYTMMLMSEVARQQKKPFSVRQPLFLLRKREREKILVYQHLLQLPQHLIDEIVALSGFTTTPICRTAPAATKGIRV